MEYFYEKCHLWMGNLKPHMDENYLIELFKKIGSPLLGLRLIKNQLSGEPMHTFLQFETNGKALSFLYEYDAKPIPGLEPEELFDLGIASESLIDERPYNGVWVGNITLETTKSDIIEAFAKNSIEVPYVFMPRDVLGLTKGYAFLKFNTEWEKMNAIRKMNNYMGLGGSMPLIVREGHKKKMSTNKEPVFGIFIGNLNVTTTTKELCEYLCQKFPSFKNANIPLNRDGKPKGFGTALFLSKNDQMAAIKQMNKTKIFGKRSLKVVELLDKKMKQTTHYTPVKYVEPKTSNNFEINFKSQDETLNADLKNNRLSIKNKNTELDVAGQLSTPTVDLTIATISDNSLNAPKADTNKDLNENTQQNTGSDMKKQLFKLAALLSNATFSDIAVEDVQEIDK